MWKDKGLQLVMLPTPNSSNLGLYIDTKNLVLRKQSDIPRGESQHLYLLSDEEIRTRDWVIDISDNSIFQIQVSEYTSLSKFKKVIASTNPSLNLPQFPSSFLEEYVKRYNSKKSLEVDVAQPIRTEKICQNCIDYKSSYHCEICNSNLDMFKNVIDTISIRFKEEKMYNRSEVERIILNFQNDLMNSNHNKHTDIDPVGVKNWIKENLK